MKRLLRAVRNFLYDVSRDINERLGVFFINIGKLAAVLGVFICLLAHAPVEGTISAALIAATAPLIAGFTRHSGHQEHYGSLVGIMIIIMIPVVWLTTGAESGGSGFWFLYELFYITLFTQKKQRVPFYIAAVLVQAAAITADWLRPDWFFHFTDRTDAFVSRIGSGVVVTAEILITVLVQKALYVREREINTKTQDTTRNFVMSIANTIDTKDPYTGGHSRRVAECASAIALRLGMSKQEADNMYFVALLHDIGKIGVPDRVLNKPGRLTDEEFSLIRKHPIYGAEILRDVTLIPHVREGVLYHHEHYDGTGYPEGLKGEEIPYVARVIAVADAYDAMSTNRIYRKYIKREQIIHDMIKCRGTQFDPHIVDVFVEMLIEGFRIESAQENNIDSVERNLAVAAGEMMRHISESRQQTEQRGGATNVDNVEFTNLYDYLRNLSRRYGDEMMLINISLDTKDIQSDNEKIFACTADLGKAIMQNIRSVDICTRNGTTSYLVLLLNAPRSSLELIIGRITRDFYRLQGSMDVTLCHNIIETGAQIPKPQ